MGKKNTLSEEMALQYAKNASNVFDFQKDIASKAKAQSIQGIRNDVEARGIVETSRVQAEGGLSARQKLLFQAETGQKWYSGETPTSSEILARIYTIGLRNKQLASQLYDSFNGFMADPSNLYYNPYLKATSRDIEAIADLGIDVSGGINDQFFKDNAWLMNYYRLGTGNSPLGPANKATKEQTAAYYYERLLDQYETTQQAQKEWDALKETIGYWAGREDRNYSDQEILDMIDWSQYKTLLKMDEDRSHGLPTQLTSAIGYSKDNLKGVIWAARNGSTGDAMLDAVQAVLGNGNTWKQNDEISAKLDPSNKAFSPYSVGSTLDDAALYFGVASFGKDWLEKNRAYLAGNDATAKKMYQKVYDAEQTTIKAEDELKELWDTIEKRLEFSSNPDVVLAGLDGAYPTLTKMDESLKRAGKGSSDLLATTRAVNYRWQDVVDEVNRRIAEKQKAVKGSAHVVNINSVMKRDSIYHTGNTYDAVQESRNNAVNNAGMIIFNKGTKEEQIVFKVSYDADYDNRVQQINDAIKNGEVDGEKVYSDAITNANENAGSKYMGVLDVLNKRDKMRKQSDDAQKEIDDILKDMPKETSSRIVGVVANAGASDMPMKKPSAPQTKEETAQYYAWLAQNGMSAEMTPTRREESYKAWREAMANPPEAATQGALEAYLESLDEESRQKYYMARAKQEEADSWLTDNAEDVSNAEAEQKNILEDFDIAERLRQEYKIDTGDTSILKDVELLHSIGSEYKPTVYSSLSALDAMMQEYGFTYEAAAEGARQFKAEYQQELAEIVAAVEHAGPYMDVTSDFERNLNREKARLEREIEACDYFLVRDNKDFLEKANAARERITEQVANSFLGISWLNGVSEADRIIGDKNFSGHIYHPNGYIEPAEFMNDDEKNTYLYLYETQGKEAAKEYYNYLKDDTYGVLTVRQAKEHTENAAEFTKEHPILSNIINTLSSPNRMLGGAYGMYQLITGNDVNPYSQWYNASNVNQSVKSTTKQLISDEFEDSPFLATIANGAYDVVTSAAESGLNAAMLGAFGGVNLGSEAATGVLEKFGLKATEAVISAVPMAFGAMGDTIQEVTIAGGKPEQAFLMGGVSFLAEAVSEGISVENILDAFDGGAEATKSFIKTVLKSAAMEGSEEIFSEAVEQWADDKIMGELSKKQQYIAKYQAMGYTDKDEIEKLAAADLFKDVLKAGLMGSLSGGLSTGVAYGAGAAGRGINKMLGVESVSDISDQGRETTQETVEAKAEPAENAAEITPEAVEAPQAQAEEITPEAVENQEAPAAESAEVTPEAVNPEEAARENVRQQVQRDIAALTASINADAASQTATAASVLTPEGSTNWAMRYASAAAQHLSEQLGGEKMCRIIGNSVYVANKTDISVDAVKNSIVTAGLNPNGAANAIVTDMAQNGVNIDSLRNLVRAAAQETQSAGARMRETVVDNMVAQREKQLIADGALQGMRSYEVAYDEANRQVHEAESRLEEANKKLQSMARKIQTLVAQHNQNPTDQKLGGMLTQAIKDMTGQEAVVGEYTQSLENAQHAAQTAQDTLAIQEDAALSRVRQQALADVNAQLQQEAVERAAQEAAAQAAQEAQAQNIDAAQSAVQPESEAPAHTEAAQETPQAESPAQAEVIPAISDQNTSPQEANQLAPRSELPAHVPPTDTGTPTTDANQPNNQRQRQFGNRTAQRSDALHNEVKDYLYTHSGYTPDSNGAQIDRAIDWVQSNATEEDPDGYRAAVQQVLSDDFNYASADGQVRMLTVLGMAAIQGDTATEQAIADRYNRQGTNLGQAMQARNIFNLMTPLGRIAVLQNEVDRINQQYITDGRPTRVSLSQETLDLAANAKTGQDFANVRRRAERELAAQMPPTWRGKLREWRMMSMLANPRTHVRNILGNAIFMPAVKLKNVIGAAIEAVYLPGTETHTKSVRASKERRQFARADANNNKDILTGERKYNPDSEVEAARKQFGTGSGMISKTIGKSLQAISDFNAWALEAEDWLFLKKHYADALAGWMQANKLTPEAVKNNPELLARGRQYAIQEAQKATYRDASEIASLLNRISQNGGLAGFAVEAALPFKKTPANILKRGIEYSPVGLIQTLMTGRRRMAQYEAWQNGQLTSRPRRALSPQQFVDGIASGLSGTAIMAVGALLASMGVVTVSLDDDDDEFKKLAGAQEYSINISIFGKDVSFTIDWAAPVSLPFFVGASIYDALSQDKEIDIGAIADAILQITEPVFNLSMLDGVNSLLKVNSWDSGTPMTQIGEKLVTNYLSSYVPTFLGQVSRTIDPVRRKSYVESGASLQTWRYALEQVQNKTPFSTSNIPYRDPWGNEDRSDTWMAALENFISPGYISEIKPDKVDQELERLYGETHESSTIPKLPSKKIGDSSLTDKEYDQYTTVRGTTAKNVITDLMQSSQWLVLDDAAKAALVEDAWNYANQVAKAEVKPGTKQDKWVSEANQKGNPASAIIERYEDKMKQEYVKGYKTALEKAIDSSDYEAAANSIEALKAAGQEKSTIKSYVTSTFKPKYKDAVAKGHDEEALDIAMMLYSLGLGYTQNDLKNWLK